MTKNASNYLEERHKIFKEDDSKGFRKVQKLTMGESNAKQFMRPSNQLVMAAEKKMAESKTCHLQILQQGPRTWINNSTWLTGC